MTHDFKEALKDLDFSDSEEGDADWVRKYDDTVRAALELAIKAQDDWQLVPREPTGGMIKAGMEACMTKGGTKHPIPMDIRTKLKERGYEVTGEFLIYTGIDEYKAMLSAAPQPSTTEK